MLDQSICENAKDARRLSVSYDGFLHLSHLVILIRHWTHDVSVQNRDRVYSCNVNFSFKNSVFYCFYVFHDFLITNDAFMIFSALRFKMYTFVNLVVIGTCRLIFRRSFGSPKIHKTYLKGDGDSNADEPINMAHQSKSVLASVQSWRRKWTASAFELRYQSLLCSEIMADCSRHWQTTSSKQRSVVSWRVDEFATSVFLLSPPMNERGSDCSSKQYFHLPVRIIRDRSATSSLSHRHRTLGFQDVPMTPKRTSLAVWGTD